MTSISSSLVSFSGGRLFCRYFYEVQLDRREIDGLPLGEGSDFRVFSAREALSDLRLVLYNAFALGMHTSRRRLHS